MLSVKWPNKKQLPKVADMTARRYYHFGLLVDLTIGDIPSRYKDFVLLKLTMLNITLCKQNTANFVQSVSRCLLAKNIHFHFKTAHFCDSAYPCVVRVLNDVCLSFCLFFHAISQKPTQVGSPNLTSTWSTMSPANPFILGSKGQGHEAEKQLLAWVMALLWELASSNDCGDRSESCERNLSITLHP